MLYLRQGPGHPQEEPRHLTILFYTHTNWCLPRGIKEQPESRSSTEPGLPIIPYLPGLVLAVLCQSLVTDTHLSSPEGPPPAGR